MKIRARGPFPWCLALALGVLTACAPLIGTYSLDAYKNATSLKAETVNLVAKSGESYAVHKADVDALSVKIDAAYEFSHGLANNSISAEQWAILKDPRGGLWGEFVRDWSSEGVTRPAYRTDKALQLGRAFDQIICLEANKQSATKCPHAAGGAK